MKITKARLKQIITEELESEDESGLDAEKLDIITSEDGVEELKRVLTLRLDVSDEDAALVANTFVKSVKEDEELYLTNPEQLLALARELAGEKFQDMVQAALNNDMGPEERNSPGLTEEKDNWMDDLDPKHKGYCTPMTKKTCTPPRKALAKRFKKAGRKKEREGGTGWQGKV
jgi:hypothetical protein